MSALLGAKAAWYLMRASGFVAFGLLTITLALGVANVARWERGRWTRAAAALVHRNASLLAVVFLAVHIATAVSDKYVSIPSTGGGCPRALRVRPAVGRHRGGFARRYGGPDRHQPLA